MSNVVFVESPAFVGFSYSNSSVDKVVGATLPDLVMSECRRSACHVAYIAGHSLIINTLRYKNLVPFLRPGFAVTFQAFNRCSQ